MGKLETTAEFVLELHKIVGSKGQEMIQKEFPVLFEVKLEVGRWYFYKEDDEVFIFQRVKEGSELVFGWFNGTWFNKEQDTWYCGDKTSVRLATKEEVETMLWKEAEKRGIGKDTKIEFTMRNPLEKCYNNDNLFPEYLFSFDELWNRNGCIYKQGKWATPLDPNKEIKESIQRLEKELAELKSKVK